MLSHTIALFGAAEKGEYRTAYFCNSLPQLIDFFGEPPPDTQGLQFAIQALLYKRDLIFFRVHEEGFSTQDYLQGLNFLERKDLFPCLTALCLPGVGSKEIIEASSPVCFEYRSFIITTEKDLYDYLTSANT